VARRYLLVPRDHLWTLCRIAGCTYSYYSALVGAFRRCVSSAFCPVLRLVFFRDQNTDVETLPLVGEF